MALVTISRQMASLGDEIAQTIAQKMNWPLLTRNTVLEDCFQPFVSKQTYRLLQESARFFLKTDDAGQSYRSMLVDSVRRLAGEQGAVLVGFGSQVIFSQNPNAVHVRITAPETTRIERVMDRYHVSEADAARIIKTADRKHKRFVSTVFESDLTDTDLYDLILNTQIWSVEACANAILLLINERAQARQHESVLTAQANSHPDIVRNKPEAISFKNESEAEFARILDMYHIDWIYEPHTFPIEWDAEGNVTQAFSPDFFLPRFKTYLELTTMNQKYVTEKNKKARRLKELYPDIQVRIVYKKDFESLIERFRS